MVHRFRGYELDEGLYQLRREGQVVKLEPKTFDMLLHLVRHCDRVVSKDELLEQLWPGEFVSESVLPSNIRTLRRVLGDDRAEQRFIQTHYGRGYRFVAPLEARDGAEPEAPADLDERSPFVGREQLLEELVGSLTAALGGRGELLLLVGEPGIGKTRTAQEVAARARARGARVLAGQSYEGEGAPAFWPWVQVLRASARDRSAAALRAELGPGAADVAQLVPELRELLPELPPQVPADSLQSRFGLFDAVTSYLRRAAGEQPLAILLDDLHWADKSSLLLLGFAARELLESRVLVIGTYRDEDLRRGHPLAPVLGDLVRAVRCRRVRLRGLEPRDVAAYVERVTKREASEQLVTSLYDRTEGNPFFLGEMVRLLAGSGPDSAESMSLPEGIRDAIGRRLDGLSEPCNRMLTAAAFLGREFSLAPLERLAEVDAGRMLELLDEAQAPGIVTPLARSVGRYRFSHALVRETLYEEVSAPLRVRIHRRAGEVLEEIHAENLDPHLAELAHHFFQAAAGGEAARAVAWGRRAAERAMELLAWEEAAGHYERVLEALELAVPVDGAARCETLLDLAHAYGRAGERERARSCFLEAGRAARTLGRSELLARAALGFGARASGHVGPDEELRALLEEALAAHPPGDSAARAALLALASAYPHFASAGRRAELSEEALQMARRVGARWALVQALMARAAQLSGEDASERLAIGAELLEAAQKPAGKERGFELHDPAWVGHDFRHGALLALGDVAAADRELAALEQKADEQRQPFQRFEVAMARFGRAHAAGRLEEARTWIERGRGIADRLEPTARYVPLLQEFLLAREFGPQLLPGAITGTPDPLVGGSLPSDLLGQRDPSQRTGVSTDAIRAGIEQTIPWLAPFATLVLAHAALQRGERDRAGLELASLAKLGFEAVPRDANWLILMGLAAEVAAGVGDRSSAERLYALLEPHGEMNLVHPGLEFYLGSGSHFLGVLAATCGNPERSLAHLQEALLANQRMQADAHVTRTQLALARGLAGAGQRGRARVVRERALRRARELGLAVTA